MHIDWYPYLLIFYNSMQTNLLLSFRSENAWFAAHDFGIYDITLATIMAFAGSSLGMVANYAVGYYVSRWRDELPSYREEAYQRLVKLFENRLFMLMVIPRISLLEGLPGIAFMPLFVCICGLFRVPLKQGISAILLSRVIFYGYYLMQ